MVDLENIIDAWKHLVAHEKRLDEIPIICLFGMGWRVDFKFALSSFLVEQNKKLNTIEVK